MATGISLHIGINQYNHHTYRELHRIRLAHLHTPANDAQAYLAVAQRFGFKPAIFINEKATAENMLKGIEVAARSLRKGDIFFLSFSGHGGKMLDKDGDEKQHDYEGYQPDAYDETWCLYDQMVADDELYSLFKRFGPGVRILVVADSCHSGTSIKNAQSLDEFQATGLLMAACQDDQFAYTGNNENLSLYTYWMMQVLRQYDFCHSYQELHNKIARHMPKKSQPNLFPFGVNATPFIKQKPFTI
jgi:metacaspase-1